MTVGGHGGMTCMAQEYHGDGDVDGPSRKIGNVGVTHVDERKACYAGREMEGPKITRGGGKDDVMVTWGCPFILVAFKTLGLFNLFLSNT